MDKSRTIYVAGNYIAEQHIGTYIAQAEHVHTDQPEQASEPRIAEDVTFEEVSVYCVYLDIDAIKRAGIWTPAMVQEQLEKASEKDAKEFVAFLRDFEKKTYLNFHGDNKRKIYTTLRAQLPMMRAYTESNFYAYF
jgi:kynurenine formamidase